MQKIDLKIEGQLEHIAVTDLEPLQGELKKLSDGNFNKLRSSMIEKGFKLSLHVWKNGGINYLIDGHQRVHVLQQLVKEGYEVPAIPCVIVQARNYREAKETVLLAVSQYGKLDKDGFDEFVEGEGFDFEDFDFPDVGDEFLKFDESETKTETLEGSKELDENDFQNFDHECPRCGFEWDDKK